ncbi:pentapeptide repeat-containing protein [Bacillus sp. FJAT-49732]|uniref:Pentapeptide repeat-containing protein n=1 Tax=Lederbergia citrisecunda TaxID=2833583 RepID=A0A942YP86_9BACI|nr:pentapeptide repeat-containing protein [Lederbergia citrisecunda]MBS4201051.1 pentapeptide repeat-containing protein [Lederbergia citrisecunda]
MLEIKGKGMNIMNLQNQKQELNMADISTSTFTCVLGHKLYFENVDLSDTKIVNANLSRLVINDANLSDLEIDGAQLGGAYIHNIGLPPEGHPNYEPNAKQRPLKFENCNLNDSTITDCNLENVEINMCNIKGMKINGVSVEEMLKVYSESKV